MTVLTGEYTCVFCDNQVRNCGFSFLYYSFILQNEMKNNQIKSKDYYTIMVMNLTIKNYSSYNRGWYNLPPIVITLITCSVST